jgi:hypothetical protein
MSIKYLRTVLTFFSVMHQCHCFNGCRYQGSTLEVTLTPQPDKNLGSFLVDPSHDPDLVISLCCVALINTKGIDPHPFAVLVGEDLIFFGYPKVDTSKLDVSQSFP